MSWYRGLIILKSHCTKAKPQSGFPSSFSCCTVQSILSDPLWGWVQELQRAQGRGEIKKVQSRDVFLLTGEIHWIYVSMNLCAWMFKFENITTHVCLKPFRTICTTFLPFSWRIRLKEIKTNSFGNLEDFLCIITKESCIWLYEYIPTMLCICKCLCVSLCTFHSHIYALLHLRRPWNRVSWMHIEISWVDFKNSHSWVPLLENLIWWVYNVVCGLGIFKNCLGNTNVCARLKITSLKQNVLALKREVKMYFPSLLHVL